MSTPARVRVRDRAAGRRRVPAVAAHPVDGSGTGLVGNVDPAGLRTFALSSPFAAVEHASLLARMLVLATPPRGREPPRERPLGPGRLTDADGSVFAGLTVAGDRLTSRRVCGVGFAVLSRHDPARAASFERWSGVCIVLGLCLLGAALQGAG